MKFKQFDIWLADLSPRFGTEPGKTRPVLVMQSDLLNNTHPSTIICPITTNIYKKVKILRINIDKEESGLNKESALMIDQIRAIDNKRFIKKIGKLSSPQRKIVAENLKIILDLG
jgi:mRNA interferase MazF